MKRRAVLASGGGVLAMLAGALPFAHADATVPGAHAEVVGVSYDGAPDKPVDRVVDGLTARIFAGDTAFKPVVMVWGQHNWLMQSWGEGEELAPGQTRWVTVEAPDPATRLYPSKRAQVSVFDKGSERRVQTQFVPAEVDDGDS